jgi:hypothetical protein
MTTTRLYAEGTAVSAETSQQEIIKTLKRYGADGFIFGEDQGFGLIGFRAHGRQVRFLLPLEVDRATVRTQRSRTAIQVDAKVAAEIRRRWRALALAIKAKLEVVESGIASFEEEFLAHIVINGDAPLTVGQLIGPQLEENYRNGRPLELLPGVARAVSKAIEP